MSKEKMLQLERAMLQQLMLLLQEEYAVLSIHIKMEEKFGSDWIDYYHKMMDVY